MEIVHKKYGELNKKEKDDLFNFRGWNCTLPIGVALKDPKPNHDFVGIWKNVPSHGRDAQRKLVAVGIYRPVKKEEACPKGIPEEIAKVHIASLDVDEEHRREGLGVKLLGEIVKGIANENGGKALIKMYPVKELAATMRRLGFVKDGMYYYLLPIRS